jgi:putative component of toxin-antitoxin plasmid stabilization module
MKPRQLLGSAFILLGVIISVSNLSMTGAVIGSPLSNYFSFLALAFLLVGVLLMKSGIENKVINSKVKENPLLLRTAKNLGQDEGREVNHLIEQLNKGNTNPGVGTRTVFSGVYELRGRNGGRVYFRNIGKEKYEILGYSDKDSQLSVINRLRELYENS